VYSEVNGSSDLEALGVWFPWRSL